MMKVCNRPCVPSKNKIFISLPLNGTFWGEIKCYRLGTELHKIVSLYCEVLCKFAVSIDFRYF